MFSGDNVQNFVSVLNLESLIPLNEIIVLDIVVQCRSFQHESRNLKCL